MKNKIRKLTRKNSGQSNEVRKKKLKEYVVGWINYFKHCKMIRLLERTDSWMRRKIRAIYWKQWKNVKTRYKKISKYGIPSDRVHQMANCRKGTWRATLMLNTVLTIKVITNLGYISMTDYYKKCCEN